MKPRDLLVCLVVISGIGIIVGIVFIHSKKDKYTSGSPDELYGCCSYNKTNPNSLCGHAYADKVCTNNSELAGWTGCQTSTGDKLPVCFAKGTGCICNGFTCTGGGEGCDCGDTNLDSGSGCKKCRDGYEFNKLPDGTIDWEGKPCVPKPNPCKNGGTLGADGKCKCLTGFSGDDCECTVLPTISSNVDVSTTGTAPLFSGCHTLLVCPYGDGTSLNLDSCTHSKQKEWASKNSDGCYIICPGAWDNGPDCQFTSTSKTGTETVTITQDQCLLSSGTVTVSGATNYASKEGDYWDDYSGQVYIGAKKTC